MMDHVRKIIDTHEIGMMLDHFSDGTASVTCWVDGETNKVVVKDLRSAIGAAEQMARAWADGFKGGPE